MKNGWKNIPQSVEGETNKKTERSSQVRNQRDERIEVELFLHLWRTQGKMFMVLENEIVARSTVVIMRLNLQWWQGSQRQPRDQTCSYWSSSHRQPLGWVNIRKNKCTIIAVTTIITLPLNYIWSKYIQILRDFLKPLETSQYCVGLAFTT